MGIAPTFGNGAIVNQVALFQQRVEEAAVFLLQYLGEELAKYAKDNHTYTDRTGNLTNSIGYVVARGKDVVFSGGLSGEGENLALQAAMKLIDALPNRYSLVIVAGMNYAAYVEAKGYNVILPAELKAKAEFPQAMRKLMDKAKAKAQEMFGTTL